MKQPVVIVVAMFGILIAFAGNGLLRILPTTELHAPKASLGFTAPVLAFALLALLLGAKPRLLSVRVVAVGTAVLTALSCVAILPPLLGTGRPDAQSGLFEYAVCIATLPAAILVALVAAIVRLVSRSTPTKNSQVSR